MLIRILSLSACFLSAASLFAQEQLPRVQLDVTILTGPVELLNLPELKSQLEKGTGNSLKTSAMESSAVAGLVRECREKHGAKLLANLKLVTQSSREGRLQYGQIKVPAPEQGPDNLLGIKFFNIGSELAIRPVVRSNCIYLDVQPLIRTVNFGTGVQTPSGPIPGVDEQTMRFSAELNRGQTLVACCRDGRKALLMSVTPHLLDAPNPSDDRKAKVAAKLVQRYRDALANGDKELAREFAQMALDLDPGCFAAEAIEGRGAAAIVTTPHVVE